MKYPLSLLSALALGAGSLCGASTPPALRDAKADTFLRGDYRIGYYLYLWSWQQGKDPSIRDVEREMERIAEMGFNYIYVAGVADNQLWSDILALAERRRIALIAQLGAGAYLTKESNIDQQVAIAVPFIKKYKDHPAVIAFLIKEEPSPDFMPRIQEYYSKVLEEVPDAPLYLMHNTYAAASMEMPPYPPYSGTDRYPFWWEFGTGANRATPASAFRWYHTQIDAYYQLAKARQQSFEVVLTDWIQELYRDKDQLEASIYPKEASAAKKQEIVARFLRLAEAGNHGLHLSKEGKVHIWKYYRPPTNSTSAMAWLAVMEGADAISNYTWSHPQEREKTRFSGTLGWGSEGLPSTVEYARFAKDIRPFGRLLRSATKETTALLEEPIGHEAVLFEAPKNPPIIIGENENALWRSFTLPGFTGKLVILVNTRVGDWSEGRSPERLSESDLFRIDEEGNLIDYTPFYLPRSIPLQLATRDTEVIDLTGNDLALPVDPHGKTAVWVRPGEGKILFLAPKGSDEITRLKALYFSR